MNNVFYNYKSLTYLNLDGFATQTVGDFTYMFYSCSSLTSLDLTSFSNEYCYLCEKIFDGCYNMTLYLNPKIGKCLLIIFLNMLMLYLSIKCIINCI